MDWNSNLNDLRNVLASLYPDEDNARRLASQAGLQTTEIEFKGSAINIWHNILLKALSRNKVEDLIREVLEEYNEQKELLNAVERYVEEKRWRRLLDALKSGETHVLESPQPPNSVEPIPTEGPTKSQNVSDDGPSGSTVAHIDKPSRWPSIKVTFNFAITLGVAFVLLSLWPDPILKISKLSDWLKIAHLPDRVPTATNTVTPTSITLTPTLLLTLAPTMQPSTVSNAVITTIDGCSPVTKIPTSECEALVTLYNNTDGPNWITKTNWLETNTPCNWYGVTCEENHVVHILLPENNLNGSLSPTLAEFTTLGYLNLYGNPKLVGTIPTELGNLSQLNTLSLYGTGLEGPIPAELGDLANLEILWLANNRHTGSIPKELGKLSKLRSLHLGRNQLSGEIPVELGNLSSLTFLVLGANQLTDEIPSGLGNLVQLDNLSLDENNLTGAIPASLGELQNLKYLGLAANDLMGPIPTALAQITTLEGLWLQENSLTGTLPQQIGQLSNLKCLRLNNNGLTGDIPDSLINLVSLADPTECPFVRVTDGLDLGNNHFNTDVDSELSTFLSVKDPDWKETQTSIGETSTFSCSQLNVTEIPTIECEALVALYNSTDGPNWITKTNWLETTLSPCTWYRVKCDSGTVTDLYLEKNELSGTIPVELARLSHLKVLSLSQNKLEGTIPKELGSIVDLSKLYLYENQLSGSIPVELSHLSQLQELRLDNNNLTGEIPSQIGSISGLIELNLSSNGLTGDIPLELQKLTKLVQLVLNQNQLQSKVPAELKELRDLQILWLYSNQLTGPIPAELGKLVELTSLSLDHNQLNGNIPSTLGGLSKLVNLSLSDNQFTGAIPIELSYLSKLINLNLSGNALTVTNPVLLEFFAQKDPDWQATQRILSPGIPAELMPNLKAGDHWFKPLDGAVYIYVPEGEFIFGSDELRGSVHEAVNDLPQQTKRTDGFLIMQTEVTNAQYIRCTATGQCSLPASNDVTWQDLAHAHHPITNISWDQANQYALWVGGQLPSEEEWEKACRGTDGRIYPWGNEADSAKANFNRADAGTTSVNDFYLDGQGDVSPYNIGDMSGNVYEWTRTPSAESDTEFMIRGGAFTSNSFGARCVYHFSRSASIQGPNIGFRVMDSVPTPASSKIIFFDDFEDGIDRFWQDAAPINAMVVDGGYQSKKAVQISYVNNASYSINMYPKLLTESGPTRLQDGKFYEVTAWCKAEENEECTIQFGDLVRNAQKQLDYFVFDKKLGTNDWIPLSVCLQQNNQRDLNVHLYAQVEGSQVLYDDVRIAEVESCP